MEDPLTVLIIALSKCYCLLWSWSWLHAGGSSLPQAKGWGAQVITSSDLPSLPTPCLVKLLGKLVFLF